MSKKKILSSQVKQLLSGVSDHGISHLLEVETDLAQTTLLLAEAIDRLGQSFVSLHKAISSEQEEINLIIDSGSVTPENISRLKVIRQDIDAHVNSAVTSLQFQDLTSQLITRTLQRCEGLRNVLQTIGVAVQDIPHEVEPEVLPDLLRETSVKLEKQSAELRELLRKAVHQQQLDSGDIELF